MNRVCAGHQIHNKISSTDQELQTRRIQANSAASAKTSYDHSKDIFDPCP
jgi:hypothetical protein